MLSCARNIRGRRHPRNPRRRARKVYTPGRIVAIDLDDSRLESAARFGADTTINNSPVDPIAAVMELTDGLGADVVLEAVRVPETFELATELIRPGGRVANLGVHGAPAVLHSRSSGSAT